MNRNVLLRVFFVHPLVTSFILINEFSGYELFDRGSVPSGGRDISLRCSVQMTLLVVYILSVLLIHNIEFIVRNNFYSSGTTAARFHRLVLLFAVCVLCLSVMIFNA
jgi:hypothetical protein